MNGAGDHVTEMTSPYGVNVRRGQDGSLQVSTDGERWQTRLGSSENTTVIREEADRQRDVGYAVAAFLDEERKVVPLTRDVRVLLHRTLLDARVGGIDFVVREDGGRLREDDVEKLTDRLMQVLRSQAVHR